MRGGARSRRLGNQAEAFVQRMLEGGRWSLVLPLQQDMGADLIEVFRAGGWYLYEVKSSSVRSRALSARLTPSEKALQERFPDRYKVIRVLRTSKGFEVLSRGA